MYNHHHYYFPELFNDSKKKLCTHEILPPPFLLPLTLGNSSLLSDLMKLSPPRTSCKCHHTMLVISSLAHFPEREVFKAPSRILFYGTCPPHFVDPFICWWTLGLFPALHSCGWCCMNAGAQVRVCSLSSALVYRPRCGLAGRGCTHPSRGGGEWAFWCLQQTLQEGTL